MCVCVCVCVCVKYTCMHACMHIHTHTQLYFFYTLCEILLFSKVSGLALDPTQVFM